VLLWCFSEERSFVLCILRTPQKGCREKHDTGDDGMTKAKGDPEVSREGATVSGRMRFQVGRHCTKVG